MIKPIIPPIHLSTTFERNQDGSYNEDFIYSSIDNPNRRELEKELADLESGERGLAFSSGMAAIHAVFQSLKTGDHVIISDDCFYQVRRLVRSVFGRWGLTHTFVNTSDVQAVRNAMQKNTQLIWIETPSNPLLHITDISALAAVAQKRGCILAVDNTWATPILQNPIKLGADIAMHSTTKYFGGHNDVVNGCLMLKNDGEMAEQIANIQKLCGAVPSPLNCWLISRGIKTLELRVKTQSDSAMRLAEYLLAHDDVDEVYYPGLATHPQHETAKGQMQNGYGGMLSLLIKGDKKRALDVSNKLKHFRCATSLGGIVSLVEHRHSVEGKDSRAPENLLRLSVGIEPVELLIEDWGNALKLNI